MSARDLLIQHGVRWNLDDPATRSILEARLQPDNGLKLPKPGEPCYWCLTTLPEGGACPDCTSDVQIEDFPELFEAFIGNRLSDEGGDA